MDSVPYVKLNRNLLIDGLRGFAVFWIVLLHTVTWSGDSYVPSILLSFALLVDIPLFFFLAGWSYSFIDNLRTGLRNILRLQIRYMVFVSAVWVIHAVYIHANTSLMEWINWCLHIEYSPSPPVIVAMASMWFMRTYIIVGIIGMLLVRLAPEKVLNMTVLCAAVVYALSYMPAYNMLSPPPWINYFFFYLAFFLLGYSWNKSRRSVFILASLSVVAIIFITGNQDVHFIDMQRQKFPPQAYYFAWSTLSLAMTMVMLKARRVQQFLQLPILQWMGRNALHHYFAQGISSSIIYLPVHWLGKLWWPIKLFLMWVLNETIALKLAQIFVQIETRIRNRFAPKKMAE